jgi:hypothetical protein
MASSADKSELTRANSHEINLDAASDKKLAGVRDAISRRGFTLHFAHPEPMLSGFKFSNASDNFHP